MCVLSGVLAFLFSITCFLSFHNQSDTNSVEFSGGGERRGGEGQPFCGSGFLDLGPTASITHGAAIDEG